MSGPASLPDVEIRLDGVALPLPARRDVRSVTVEQTVGDPAWFAIELSNWDAERQRPAWSDGPLFAVGGAVDLSLGQVGAVTSVLEGEITSVEPVFTATGPPVLTVGGYDHGHRLARTRRTRSFLKMTDGTITAQLARDAGLRAQVTDTRLTLDYVAQANQTDWAFLRERAARIGYELHVAARTLVFAPPDTDGAPAQTLVLGREVTEFRPRLSAVGQVGEVAVRGWDVAGKQPLLGTARATGPAPGGARPGPSVADAAFGASTATLAGLAPGTQAEADRIALGAWTGAALGYVRGSADCGGDPALRPGTVVDIRGAGTRFSGPYYVTAVTHSLDATGYRSSLTVERSAA